MIQAQGLWWPDDVGDRWQHALRHLASLDVGLQFCRQRRTAVQAGGNVGLWPRRLAETFGMVYTFEPDHSSMCCLIRNVPTNVIPNAAALGASNGRCRLRHKGLGSHRVIEERGDITITTIDSLELDDVDFLQLDIEGYELHALRGAVETVRRCHPVIQLELRGFTRHFGERDEDIRALLHAYGYRQVATAPGSDFIFQWKGSIL